jgi:hypothetical protein
MDCKGSIQNYSPQLPSPAAGLAAGFSPFWRRPALLGEDGVVGEDVEQVKVDPGSCARRARVRDDAAYGRVGSAAAVLGEQRRESAT